MLGKLIKYELKSTARAFLPIYAVLLFFSILGNFSISGMMENMSSGSPLLELLSGLVIMGYVMAIFSVLIVTFVVILQRFYKNLTGDEGYLMHTLPVSAHSLIQSKLIASFIWEAATVLMVVLSVFILLFQPDFFRALPEFFAELNQVLRIAFTEVGFGLILNILLFIAAMVIASISGTLLIYAAISIGHTFKKHRILGAVGAYMGLTMICQLIVGVAATLFGVMGYNFDFSYIVNGVAVSNLVSLLFCFAIVSELLFAS
ncbi:MAG: hypothetical protein RR528_07415, partial [Angelakisella sp.]